MPDVPAGELPDQPSLEQLRKQAKDLRRADRIPLSSAQLAVARLLEAGADPNDGQALYNRMFEPGNDHLELLFEFGLGTGDGGPWRRRLGDALDTPAAMVRGELAWAITHGLADRVRLLEPVTQPDTR